MKWRSHISIGKAIADRLKMPPGERKAFLDGMVEPDRHKERISGPGYSYRVSHHRPPRRVIMLHIWMARRSFLINDNYQGCRHLGMALHYIQDKSTSKGSFGLTHARREAAIAELGVPLKAVDEGLSRFSSSPDFVSRSIALTKPLKDPSAALGQASFRSAAVAAAVMDLRQCPDVKIDFQREVRRHFVLRAPLAIGASAIALSTSLAWSDPLPVFIALPILAAVLWMDRGYRRLRRLAGWHGLRSH